MATNSLPPLNARYTAASASTASAQSGSTNASGIGAAISEFYNSTFSNDVKATQNDAANHIDNPQNDSKVAADIAMLHNLDVQFAQASGDTSDVSRLQAHPDQLLDTTSNQLLQAAGVNHKDTDFTYSGQATSTGVLTQARLTSDSSHAMGTAQYQFGPSSGVLLTNSSVGNTGKDWGLTASSSGTTQSQQGGLFDQGDGQRIVSNLGKGDSTAGFTPRQFADAYASLSQMSGSDRQKVLDSNPQAAALWAKGSGAGLSADPTTNTDAFNKLVTYFSDNT